MKLYFVVKFHRKKYIQLIIHKMSIIYLVNLECKLLEKDNLSFEAFINIINDVTSI